MDLLAPCRSCLQCLPFFHISPPSSPRPAAAVPSSSPYSQQEASEATSTDPSQSSENLPCSNAATAAQEQDLPPPSKEEKEPQDAKCDKDETAEKFEDEHSESEVLPVSEIVIAPAVSASSGASFAEDVEDNKTTTLSELPLQVPFINDITFSAPGLMPLPSPITPAPFGAGYPAGQYPPYDQIYQGQHHEHAHSHEEHENSHHGHEHSLHGHESSHFEHASSQHGHDHSHHGPSHVHAAPDYEAPFPQSPLDNSQVIHELHKDASFHQPHHHIHDALIVDDADNSVTGHASLNDDIPHHDQIDDISLTPPLETSQSTPDLDPEAKVGVENSAVSHTNGASALLETYHSEPVVVFGDAHDDDNEAHDEVLGLGGPHPPPRRRHRDHFKDQFKGIKQQIKQGGHHVKEEGSKHMKTIIENMNKQAQQIEQSGSFFMVPRANNN